ncbi:type II toxin-antitoxin system VapB family antitoxin [Dyadobacter pollutisoli]|uniref:DUF2281 domain-containing protein n=1 Tax=Dyadobacter pollutisoli TaxID=2910158 RepID=A0A9E8SI92_9BACT|nr:DUF2281 domain-containing protein [Dyadobacter pollutisoli]WAC09930.1 DUF2281 domain-containing protein [Dyadobacter pollutisoli]
MTDLKLYTKLSGLPQHQKAEVSKFIDSLKPKSRVKSSKRVAGLAKGLIEIQDGFDDPILGFQDYI